MKAGRCRANCMPQPSKAACTGSSCLPIAGQPARALFAAAAQAHPGTPGAGLPAPHPTPLGCPGRPAGHRSKVFQQAVLGRHEGSRPAGGSPSVRGRPQLPSRQATRQPNLGWHAAGTPHLGALLGEGDAGGGQGPDVGSQLQAVLEQAWEVRGCTTTTRQQ